MPRDAYFYYGLGNNQEVLVSCYHNSMMGKSGYNVEKIRAKKRGVLIPSPTEANLNIENNEVLKNIENAILSKLEKIIEELGGIQAVASLTFIADVNLCTAANEILADFLINNKMLEEWEKKGILVNRILESSNGHVIRQAEDVHRASFNNSPIILRTKIGASDPHEYTVPRTPESVEEINQIRNDKLKQIDASASSVGDEAAMGETLPEGDISSEDFAAISEEVKEQAAILDAISKPVDNELSAIEKKIQQITLNQVPANDTPEEDGFKFK
ncbi:Uncharacterised protein [Legionella beliardensis]|uniref:Uncharacterized protein n=1 Tax=Legionella beliardensis TaxID=91822 RepID=A0A378I4V7_9GAMM|nr:hypothetical protein [Legionella beliardensis]STX29701.1 Uncharacterised protein [Legionella beliardensis]